MDPLFEVLKDKIPIETLSKDNIINKIYLANKDRNDLEGVEPDTELYNIKTLRQGLLYDYDKDHYKICLGKSTEGNLIIGIVQQKFLDDIEFGYKHYKTVGQFVKANLKYFVRVDQAALFNYHLTSGNLPPHLKTKN